MVVFIEYDANAAQKTSKDSRQSSELLFVDCNDGGKPSQQSRSRLNRHAAIKSMVTGAKKDRLNALQDRNSPKEKSKDASQARGTVPAHTLKFRLEQHSSSSPPETEQNQKPRQHQTLKKAHTRTGQHGIEANRPLGDPQAAQLITDCPYGAFPSPLPTFGNKFVSTMINWFFLGKERVTSRGTLKVATEHWIKKQWDWAVKHEALFEGLALNVMKKRMDIEGADGGKKRDYLRHKGQIMQRLRRSVQTRGPELDSPTMFIIANMAIHAFQDGDPKAARIHLEALEAIRAPEKIPPYEWIGTWIVDFRLALILGCTPAFSYYVPYDHAHMVPDIDQIMLEVHTSESMKLLPQSTTYDDRLRDLVHQIWQFYLASVSLADCLSEPFGMIYNLEYSLRTLHAEIWSDQGDIEPSPAVRRSVELTLYAIQFHLWLVARHWEPLSWGVRMFCIRKAFALLTLTDFLHDWVQESDGSPSSLMWILSTLTFICIDEGDGLAPIPLLSRAIELLDITTIDAYLTEMKRWPWLKNWHAVHMPRVWETVAEYGASLDPSVKTEFGAHGLWKASSATESQPRKLFVGAVEFYDI